MTVEKSKIIKKRSDCAIAPYNPERDFDELFEVIIKGAYEACKLKDKSATILCAGDVGSGKSTLMFFAMLLVMPEPDLKRIGFNTKTFAQAIQASESEKAPFLAHDEMNLNARNSMSEGNKDFIDLMFSIRGKNWFLWANNPSVQSIDKQLLLEGLVNIVIFVHKEQEKYLLFTRQALLEMVKERGSVSFYNLKTYGPKYAVYEGWFKAYKGPLWKQYTKLKNERMNEKLDTYVTKYSQGNIISINVASNKLNINWGTAKRAFNWACAEKLMKEGQHFITTGTRHPKLTESGYEVLKDVVKEQQYL